MCASILDRFEKLTKRKIHVWNLIILVMAYKQILLVIFVEEHLPSKCSQIRFYSYAGVYLVYLPHLFVTELYTDPAGHCIVGSPTVAETESNIEGYNEEAYIVNKN
jgi:hypothetical protein